MAANGAQPMAWHINRNGKTAGPILLEKLGELVRSGKVEGKDLVWQEGMPEWIPAHTCVELAALFAPPPLVSVAPAQPPIQPERINPPVVPAYSVATPPLENPLKKTMGVARGFWVISLILVIVFWAVVPPGPGGIVNLDYLAIKLQGQIGWGMVLLVCTAYILAFHIIEVLLQIGGTLKAGQLHERLSHD